MKNRLLLLVVLPAAFGLNAWLGDRAPVGEMCPVLTSPWAVAEKSGAASDDGPTCVRQCPVPAPR